MKKTFAALPTMAVVVSMFAASVFAASPTAGTKPISVSGGGYSVDDIIIIEDEDLEGVDGEKATDLGFSAKELQKEVDKIDSSIDAKDLEVFYTFGAYLKSDYDANGPETAGNYRNVDLGDDVTIKVSCDSEDTDAVLVFHYVDDEWQIVGKADSTSSVKFTVDSLSPFAVAKASAETSAQTGDYAGTYIIMVAVALVAAGAVFAIRAKKATK
ncbi:MAG: hypothetical protein IKH76_09860 [Clostridiales bacterium]|nr:hypothetical protein [Clostridiales bacterium]